MAPSSSSSSSQNWVYDVFPSFNGKDVRVTFLSHFLKELDRKLITFFKDNNIERGRSLDPELKHAIIDSRISVVMFSKNYPSSSWCLNELLEIVRCKEECGQMVIPVFYGLDPSHVRKQTGDFGKIFEETCRNKTEELKFSWRRALTVVASILGYHTVNWGNEATMIEAIANDVLGKLLLTQSKDFENFVGIGDHLAQMSKFLHLESEEVRMVGIWGSSGIGKTTIARVLFSRLRRHFKGSVYIDNRFIYKSMKIYSKGNSDDYNMKLHLQEKFLSKILDKQGIEVDHLGAVREKLKDMKVLIVIDDLDEPVVLDTLVGGNEWFGPGSRIIVITKDRQILRGHGITCIYEVGIPSEEVALQIFCQSAFRQHSPPDGFMKVASEVAVRAGGLPLGLSILGSSMRGRNKNYWIDMLPTLQKGLDGKIEKALRVSYDRLERKEHKTLFRHIACFFNGDEINNIKLMLEDSELNVDIGLKVLVDKSLIRLIPLLDTNIVEMHCLVEEMGKEIVRAQSKEPGEWEFLIDLKHVCDVLEDNTGTKKILGISLDIDEMDELRIHKNAFEGMRNLRFLNFYTNKWDHKKEVRWHLNEGFDYLPPKLRLLRLDGYPMRCLPSNFRPENLVKLQMQGSKLDKLWDGAQSITGLRNMDLFGCENLKEIPDLAMATNLRKLVLSYCSSLVELPNSIKHLNKLEQLHMLFCENLETLPTGINLRSLYQLTLRGCSRLKSFPNISSNIEELDLRKTAIEEFPSMLRLENLVGLDMCRLKSWKTWKIVKPLNPLMTMLTPSLMRLELSDIPSLVKLPSYIQKINKLEYLSITKCTNLEILPTGINLKFLIRLDFSGCSRLSSFPHISTNISDLNLSETGIEVVPWWIEDFPNLHTLRMKRCRSLECVSLNIFKLKYLWSVNFVNCWALTAVSLNGTSSAVGKNGDNFYSSLPDDYSPRVGFNFINCFNLDQQALLQQQSVFRHLILSGEQVPSYFTHRVTGTTLTNIPLLHISPRQSFFRFRACALFHSDSSDRGDLFYTKVSCRFIDKLGNHFASPYQHEVSSAHKKGRHMVIFDCCFPLNQENASLVEHNYDHVDITFRFKHDYNELRLIGCGIRFCEDYESSEVNDLGNETDHNEEWQDCDSNDLGSETGGSEMWKDCDNNDLWS